MAKVRDRWTSSDDGTAEAPAQMVHACEWPGCDKTGDFRAPRSPDALERYRWFCLEHVRQYNASWNYYAGMSEAEVEADVRRDTIWRRPTWQHGSRGAGATDRGRRSGAEGPRIRDPYGIFGDDDAATRAPAAATPAEQAMGVLELTPPVTVAMVKARYKQLVKIHHPDANGGGQGLGGEVQGNQPSLPDGDGKPGAMTAGAATAPRRHPK